MNHLANCGEPLSEPLSEPFRDYCFKKVSRIVASVLQTFLCNIPYIAIKSKQTRIIKNKNKVGIDCIYKK